MAQKLITAVASKQARTVIKLLMAGVNPNGVEDECAVTPLHIAAQNNSLEIIVALAFAGANILARTVDGYIPLDIAAINKQNEAENLLKKIMLSNLQLVTKTYQ